MSSDSDSEEFYDAEDATPIHGLRKSRTLSRDGTSKVKDHATSSPHPPQNKTILEEQSTTGTQNLNQDDSDQQKIPKENLFELPHMKAAHGRKRFKELRQKLQTDDEDCQTTMITPPNSQNSSVDGFSIASNRTTHPFRVIEVDALSAHSLSSLGGVGRMLGGTNDGASSKEIGKSTSTSALSSSSQNSDSIPSSKEVSKHPSTVTLAIGEASQAETHLPLQEPDVIASTKASTSSQKLGLPPLPSFNDGAPIAPPRRKKKLKASASSQSLVSNSTSSEAVVDSALASPASTIESLTRELENTLENLSTKIPKGKKLQRSTSSKSSSLKSGKSLDIKDAMQGQFVVKPQDIDKLKAGGSPFVDDDLQQLKHELQNENRKETSRSVRASGSRSSVGHYSLGHPRSSSQNIPSHSKERRKSAGDENMLKHLNINSVRTRTDSGKQLTDLEILQQVTVLNLDTGERIPLSVAEEKIPQCINPLSLHIMRLTSEYVSSSSMEKEKESDEESVDTKKAEPIGEEADMDVSSVRKKTAKLKRLIGSTVKKTMHKAKTIAQEVSHARHKEDVVDLVDEVNPGEQNIKLKAANSHKGPYEFEKVQHVQELKDEHEGPIWCMKFSSCGRLLATAGQDKVLRIWIIRDAFSFFQDMRTKYNAEKVSPTPSQESLVSHHSNDNSSQLTFESLNREEMKRMIFMPKPFCMYLGHTSDLLDVSWSENYFILSSSMDKTVRLWHISRKECLCCFQHIDFVTAIVFHPRDDRYFLSGSLDGKLRLWNIPDKKVAVWNEVEGTTKLITAANFCQNGKFAVVGTYDGRCLFYNTDQLKYHTTIHVRSSRGRNAIGRKISGIEPMPSEEKILITSNDSRLRLYDLRDLNVSCKYKGYSNVSSQIKGSFSHDGKFIISGSENRDIYIWKTNHDYSKFSSVRRDRNEFWEAIKAHNAVVTCAIFAPNPEVIIKMLDEQEKKEREYDAGEKEEDPIVEQRTKGCGGYVIISADFNGCIKIFINKTKPKHSSLPASALA